MQQYKLKKSSLALFKDARGINDPRRCNKIRTYYVSYEYFCNQFLPDLECCNTERQIDWVCDMMTGEMFDDAPEDGLDLQIYYVESNHYFESLCWKCEDYSAKWNQVDYNPSSSFAMMLSMLGDSGSDSE